MTTKIKKYLPLLLLAGVAAIVVLNGWHKYLSLEQIANNRDQLMSLVEENYILSLAGFSALYIVVVALSLPGGALLTLLGGFLFGWLVGGTTTVIAATLGATVVFLVAKTSLGEGLVKRAGPWLEKLSQGFKEDATNYLLFLRLVPVFPFWLVNLAPAVLGVPLKTFIFGTIIGIIPGTFAFSFLGAGLDSIISKQKQVFETCQANATPGAEPCEFKLSIGDLVTTEMLIAFVVLGVVALIPVALKKFKKRKANI